MVGYNILMNRRKSELDKRDFNYIQTPKAPIKSRLSIDDIDKVLKLTRF